MQTNTLTTTLGNTPWGRALAPAEMERVLGTVTLGTVRQGAHVVFDGDPPSHWIGLLDGLAKMSITASDGRITTLTGATGGAWFGEGSLLRHEPFRYDVVALRDCRVARMPRSTFDWLVQCSLPFNHCLQQLMSARLGLFIGTLLNDRLLAPEARVAASLTSLYNPDLQADPGPRLDLSQGEIALLAGLSRQRTNQALKHLEQGGFITQTRGGLRVIDLEGLRAFQRGPAVAHSNNVLTAKQ